MYNRYIPRETGYERVPIEEEQDTRREEKHTSEQEYYTQCAPSEQDGGEKGKDFFSSPLGRGLSGDKLGGLKSLLKALKLEDVDSGDLLLMLIIFLILSDGDDLDLVITLGLMLLLGLGGDKDKRNPDSFLSGFGL